MNNFLVYVAQKIDAGQAGILELTGDQVLGNILNLVYFVAGIVAVIVIIIAGLAMTTSGGSADAVKKARNQILYSIIGLVVIFFAFMITNFIIGRF